MQILQRHLYRKPVAEHKDKVALFLAQDMVAAAAKRALFRHFKIDPTDFKRPRDMEDEEDEELSLLLDSAGRAFETSSGTPSSRGKKQKV
jgi:hypothetical protein